MRIGIDARLLQYSEVQRGYGQYVRSILKGLNEVAPENEVRFFRYGSRPIPADLGELYPRSSEVALDQAATWGETGSLWSRSRMQILPVVPSRARWSYLHSQGLEIQRKAKEQRLDVSFVPAPMFPEMGPLPKLPVPSVYAFHDSIPFQFRERYLDTWDVDAKRLYLEQRAAYQGADRVAAVSESAMQDAIDRFGISPDRVRVARNSIDAEFGDPIEAGEQEAVRTKYRLKHPYFVFCSILDYHKNLHVAIGAVSELIDRTGRSVQLAVIGGLPEDQRNAVRAMAFDAGLTGREVVMTGHVSHFDLRCLFQSASAVLSPSLAEGFGFPVLQGMISDVPVVGSDIAPYREIMGSIGVRLDPSNVDAWAETLGEILARPEFASKLKRGGRQRAAEFTPEVQGEQLLTIFRELV